MITDKRLIYTDANGSTCIVIPSPEYTGTVEQLAEKLNLTTFTVKNAADIPADRTFRNAWKANLSIDMVKARGVLKEKMRTRRATLLNDLDVQYIRAAEAGDAQLKNAIKAQKQTLRDVTALTAIEAATTATQLKAAWPVDLLGEL